jgi:hypothetical protein
MASVNDTTISLSDRLIAFDNLEQLLESIDNSNLLPELGLWTPLVAQLSATEPQLRMMAAWCIGTVVQNNPPAQQRLLAFDGAVERLVQMATALDGTGNDTEEESVRKKAIYAISSAVRNYQAACDEVCKLLGVEMVNAGDMGSVDGVMDGIRKRNKEGKKVEKEGE